MTLGIFINIYSVCLFIILTNLASFLAFNVQLQSESPVSERILKYFHSVLNYFLRIDQHTLDLSFRLIFLKTSST